MIPVGILLREASNGLVQVIVSSVDKTLHEFCNLQTGINLDLIGQVLSNTTVRDVGHCVSHEHAYLSVN